MEQNKKSSETHVHKGDFPKITENTIRNTFGEVILNGVSVKVMAPLERSRPRYGRKKG